MPFGRIDDDFFGHPKVCHLLSLKDGAAALGLWTVADSWCNKSLTDGHVPSFMVSSLGPFNDRHAQLLVTAKLWHKVETGYQFHDWEDFNETKKEVLAKRAKEAEKKGNQRSSKRAKKALSRSLSPGDTPGDTQKDTPGESPGLSPPRPAAPTSDIRHPTLATQEEESRVRARPLSPASSPDNDTDPGREPCEPEPALADRVSLLELIRIRFSERYRDKRTNPPSWTAENISRLKVIANWLEPLGQSGAEYERLLDRMLRNFFSDPYAEKARFSVGLLASQAESWLNPPKPVRDVRSGFVDPAPASAFKNPTDLDKVFGPEPPAAGSKR